MFTEEDFIVGFSNNAQSCCSEHRSGIAMFQFALVRDCDGFETFVRVTATPRFS
jgi:hypothetical protein